MGVKRSRSSSTASEKPNKKKGYCSFSLNITAFFHYTLKIIYNLTAWSTISILDIVIPNLAINCPVILLVIFFLMIPPPPPNSHRVWNFVSVLSDENQDTQPIIIHHDTLDKRPNLKRAKTSRIGHHGIIFHHQNDEPAMKPASPLMLYTWITCQSKKE